MPPVMTLKFASSKLQVGEEMGKNKNINF